MWNDTRPAPAAAELVAEWGAAALAQRCGSFPVASLTNAKIRWVRDNEPENAARIAAVALPLDWLSWRLRGYGPTGDGPLGPDLEQLTTDRCDASGTGHRSPHTGRYDTDLFELALSPPAREAEPGCAASGSVLVPRVVAPDGTAGTVHAALFPGMPDGVLVGAGAGDNAAGALGLGAVA